MAATEVAVMTIMDYPTKVIGSGHVETPQKCKITKEKKMKKKKKEFEYRKMECADYVRIRKAVPTSRRIRKEQDEHNRAL